MLDTISILKKAADKSGFTRARYLDDKVPTSISNVTAMTFLGDMRSMFILSSLLLRRYREESKGSRYFILCSWPGYECLFPYVDEYWAIRDESSLPKLWNSTDGFDNKSSLIIEYNKQLNYFFERIDWDDFRLYYNNGFQKEFFNKFRNLKPYLPTINSAASLGQMFLEKVAKAAGMKVFIHPVTHVTGWRLGKPRHVSASKKFWLAFAERLLKEGYTPIVYRDAAAHDLSVDLPDCIHVYESDVAKVLAAMRSVGCVIDVFQGLSRLAIAARSPFLMVEERAKYNGIKDYEIDDLCSQNLPKEYIFAFSTIIEHGDETAWNVNLFDVIVARLNSFLPLLDRDSWPSTAEVYDIVPYEKVRKRKSKKLGTKLLRVPRS